MRPSAYRLTAVVGPNPESLQLKVSPFSSATLDTVLKGDPVAITVEPLGHPLANRLLHALRNRDSLPASHSPSHFHEAQRRWRCYKRVLDDPTIQWVTPIEALELKRRVSDLCSTLPGMLAAFVAEEVLRDDASAGAIDKAMAGAITLGDDHAVFRRPTADVRQAVLADRRALLAEVPTYSAMEIGAACDSSNSNLSQRAAELRISQRLFGLRSGWTWRYPKFQFGDGLKTFVEMRQVLLNLPDEQGWERLQWFMTPRDELAGSTPMDAWSTHRQQIAKMAMLESWRTRG